MAEHRGYQGPMGQAIVDLLPVLLVLGAKLIGGGIAGLGD